MIDLHKENTYKYRDDQIVQIISHKLLVMSHGQTKSQYLYLVKWKDIKQDSWQKQDTIPQQIIQGYKRKQQQDFQFNYFEQKKSSHQNNPQQKLIYDLNSPQRPKKHTQIGQNQRHNTQKLDSQTIQKYQDLIVAQVESSSENMEQLSQDDILNSRYRMKQPKIKRKKLKSKGQIGQHSKRRNLRQSYIEDNLLIDKRTRQKQQKNYKQITNLQINKISPTKKKNLSHLMSNVEKDSEKALLIQNLLLQTVLESGMCGNQKYFLVKLRNNQTVLVSQKNMNTYFPRKLLNFYQRVVDQISNNSNKMIRNYQKD